MQTFVPYSDFEASARALDVKRLGKQRVEVIQIVRALTVPGYGWASHPAVLMWQGYEEALGRYGLTMCDVWLELGFGDTCAATIAYDLRSVGIHAIRPYPQLADGDALHAVQAAFVEHDAFQCGFCTPGQILSAVAVIAEGRAHDDGAIREAMSGNVCRCGAYPNIVAAISAVQAAR